ncbi:MAG TPA: deoxyribose-phosphate aldolase [Defluviitoga sp.]|nr:deoxyribose-phosphate aldolase [Defluviitoga sp.]HOP24190.1 deoxyribose-phosphate aldolase [Defluviitoga sp.]HPZ28218.1 deoxyribose-phosphate aldolase [Defluviitoga sp.]HQD62108.1 deoxyribose-phosphate aldolase [Defluviitoga sp.]
MEVQKLKNLIESEIQKVNESFVFKPRSLSLLPKELAKYIDHTLLKAYATPKEIEKICAEAVENEFYAVCVNPTYVSLAKDKLKGTKVKIGTVIGFPLGANTIETKMFEAQNALENGADELDMVLNIGRLKASEFDYVYKEISSIADLTHKSKKLLKVIIETCYLTKEEKIASVVISRLAGVDFVKTSTGFGTDGAKEEDVALMKFVAGPNIKVKASGGIRDLETAIKMINAGADRIGTSSGISIVKE